VEQEFIGASMSEPNIDEFVANIPYIYICIYVCVRVIRHAVNTCSSYFACSIIERVSHM